MGLVLKNKYLVKNMPKTSAKGFDTIKDGDIIEISLELTYGRGRGLYAYYPQINGIRCAGIPIINNLISKGMILEEVEDYKIDFSELVEKFNEIPESYQLCRSPY